MASDLARALWRLKYNDESETFEKVANMLVKAAGTKIHLARMALTEFLYPECKVCGGKAEHKIQDGDTYKIVKCPSCAGSGVFKYTDKYRANWLKISQAKARSHKNELDHILNVISKYDREANRISNMKLGRYDII